MNNSAIVRFYSGSGPDDRGRYLRDIQIWPDDELEDVHDYIQWIFPLTETSAFNPQAPRLTSADIQSFQESAELRAALRKSLERMLRFYGLELHSAGNSLVTRAGNFPAQSRNWLAPGNHNHLRLTRILTSTRLLGLEAEARALFQVLRDICLSQGYQGAISDRTLQFWERAAA